MLVLTGGRNKSRHIYIVPVHTQITLLIDRYKITTGITLLLFQAFVLLALNELPIKENNYKPLKEYCSLRASSRGR